MQIRTCENAVTVRRVPLARVRHWFTIKIMNTTHDMQRDHDEAVVVELTADHLRAIEAALSLARAVIHEEIPVQDPDEIGTALVAAEGLTALASLTHSA